MTINERFAEILKVKNISIKDAAILLDKSEGYVRKLMRAGESFGIEPVLLILNKIDDVSPDWLLKGIEPILKSSKPSLPQNSQMTIIDRLLNKIDEKEAKIEQQAEEIGSLKKQICALEGQIEGLQQELVGLASDNGDAPDAGIADAG